ncbi:MAG TPA: hypothetical protein VFT43_08330, partial [Candidatus Polarisedimenticolia bacterium]|nr:hypothetical protein [Candidatus Polarisedimenticolia bacterium]
MLEPTPGGSVHPQFPNPTPTGPGFGGAPDDRTERVLSPAVIHLRRLYYYLELLAAGYRHALKPEPLVRSLRAERIALGIDLPELDTVPLWSVRRQDGSMSIPFIEFILGQIGDSLESFCGTVETAPPQAIEKLMDDRRAVAGM